MSKIIGNPTTTPMAIPDWNQTNPNKADYIKNKPNNISNALIGETSGGSIKITDMSPIEHELDVSLSSDAVTDFSNVTVTKRGINLLKLPDTETDITFGGITFSVKDNKIKMVGTAISSVMFKISNGYGASGGYNSWAENEYFLPAGTYTLSVQNKSGIGDGNYPNVSAITPSKNKNGISWGGTTTAMRKTFTTDETISALYVNVYVGRTVDCEFYMQIEKDSTMNEWETYKEPETFTANADGTVDGITPLYPTTILETDNSDVTINCKYNKDINKVIAELTNAINTLSGS